MSKILKAAIIGALTGILVEFIAKPIVLDPVEKKIEEISDDRR